MNSASVQIQIFYSRYLLLVFINNWLGTNYLHIYFFSVEAYSRGIYYYINIIFFIFIYFCLIFLQSLNEHILNGDVFNRLSWQVFFFDWWNFFAPLIIKLRRTMHWVSFNNRQELPVGRNNTTTVSPSTTPCLITITRVRYIRLCANCWWRWSRSLIWVTSKAARR